MKNVIVPATGDDVVIQLINGLTLVRNRSSASEVMVRIKALVTSNRADIPRDIGGFVF